MITCALDWQSQRTAIQRDISELRYNPDLYKLLLNIDSMVTQLSRAEVDARRTRKTQAVEEKVNSINTAIKRLQHLILMAHLSQ